MTASCTTRRMCTGFGVACVSETTGADNPISWALFVTRPSHRPTLSPPPASAARRRATKGAFACRPFSRSCASCSARCCASSNTRSKSVGPMSEWLVTSLPCRARPLVAATLARLHCDVACFSRGPPAGHHGRRRHPCSWRQFAAALLDRHGHPVHGTLSAHPHHSGLADSFVAASIMAPPISLSACPIGLCWWFACSGGVRGPHARVFASLVFEQNAPSQQRTARRRRSGRNTKQAHKVPSQTGLSRVRRSVRQARR